MRLYLFFCCLSSSFLRTPHTHTLRQAHTCTHDAAWILSKPSLEDFMSNKVDRGSLSLHEVKPAGQWFDLWLSTGSWYKCAFYITAALLWTPGVSFRSVTSLHVLCVPVFLSLSSLSLSLSPRSNHLGLFHLQSAGGLSFAIRAVTSPYSAANQGSRHQLKGRRKDARKHLFRLLCLFCFCTLVIFFFCYLLVWNIIM